MAEPQSKIAHRLYRKKNANNLKIFTGLTHRKDAKIAEKPHE
jgi:hypothetical protein